MSKNYVQDKVIVITGAAGGIGKEVALQCAELGGKVIISDINEEMLKGTAAEIAAKGTVSYKVSDAANNEDVLALVQYAVDTYGRLDVFVANAGIMPLGRFSEHEKTLPAWEKCIDLNLKGPMYAMCACYDQMIEQGQGHFIVTGSIFGNWPVPGGGAYQATKTALNFLANILRMEAAGKIKVSNIKPATVRTALAKTIVDPQGAGGIMHSYGYEEEFKRLKARGEGTLSPELLDREAITNWTLSAEDFAMGIVYAINQPWGVNIAEMTLRATNENHIL